MASLMENLIDVLDKENTEYEQLLDLSMKKTAVIVRGNTAELQQITDEEQIVLNRIGHLEQKREEVLNDIANVLNKDVKQLKLTDLIEILKPRPQESKRLAAVHDKLSATISQMVRINEQNRELIQSALEMVQFDINLVQSMKAAPETANYNRGAYNTGNVMGSSGRFDAKQ